MMCMAEKKRKKKKGGYDFTSCNSVMDTVYNTDVIIPIIAKLIVRSHVGKLL